MTVHTVGCSLSLGGEERGTIVTTHGDGEEEEDFPILLASLKKLTWKGEGEAKPLPNEFPFMLYFASRRRRTTFQGT